MKPLSPNVKMQILAIDPGETSGYTIAVVESPKPPLFRAHIVSVSDWVGTAELMTKRDALFSHTDAVVCEDYRIYPSHEHVLLSKCHVAPSKIDFGTRF